MKRLLTETEKLEVRKQQTDQHGVLRCFISGEIIDEHTAIEYDHIQPFSKNGETSVSNMRIVIKELNRRKSAESLYDMRDNLKLEKLFQERKNNIRLQDIFDLKEIKKVPTAANVSNHQIAIEGGGAQSTFQVYRDNILETNYFYGRIPAAWLENDDQEGLQPRVIDYKRLISIRDHLRSHPQLAPSIARLLDNKLKLFDGQHKLAAQVLNNQSEIDVKVYISPSDEKGAKHLFDALMITNLEAHSKLKQVPFYTSTLLDRLSIIYQDTLNEFFIATPAEEHTEQDFCKFLCQKTGRTTAQSKDLLRSSIKVAALESSALKAYVAAASKDASYPLTMDLLDKTIFRTALFLEPSKARFTSVDDFRSAESHNFSVISQLLVDETNIANWVPNPKGKNLSNEERKARRIWHKGSVLTWAPYLKSILYFAFHMMTSAERDHLLYRPEIDDNQKNVIRTCFERLFSHPMWDDPDSEIDSLLVSAQKQDDLFNRQGLTENFVLYGK